MSNDSIALDNMPKSAIPIVADATITPKVSWTTKTKRGLMKAIRWVFTLKGFLITVYMLNVVAWGGMLFLLLVEAAPAMCHPSCGALYSPRRIWIEITSQILNALFCLPAFGLIPWRFRDLYWLLVWRWGIRGNEMKSMGERRLAGIHNDWFRLRGSENVTQVNHLDEDNPAVPFPIDKTPAPPTTGVRAPPTKTWKMDFVVWAFVWNTFFQTVLSAFMWHYTRFVRRRRFSA
jgi:Protein of unknown function (DUF2985)